MFLEGFKNDLATIWYDKFYRWLTVAPHGDGAFLKASRTLDLYSLGGWSVPHPLGCNFLHFALFSFSLKMLAAMKDNGILSNRASTYPILLIYHFFFFQSALGLANSFTNILFFWKKKTNLSLLFVSPWNHIIQLSS